MFLFAAAPLAARADDETLVSRWVQLGPGGQAEVRVVVTGDACPAIAIDGRETPMQLRAARDLDFDVSLCSAAVPADAKSVSVLGRAMPLVVPQPSRIVVFGDTGCRIKGPVTQDCNDPAKWPFPRIAAEAANAKPDLVIHVGDYLYRESACPPIDSGCKGSPSGDNWETWAADFFTPAAPLLQGAPWVMVRGNHEDCSRSGSGWLRLLGPVAYDADEPCTSHLAPYAVPLGGMNLAVMDDANAPDVNVNSNLLPAYRADFAALATLAPAPLWLAMHRPIWGAVNGPFGFAVGGNRTLIASLDPKQLSPVSLMLAGHIHTMEVLNYGDGLPPQIVAGYGGDNLDAAPADLAGVNLSGQSVHDGLTVPGFGFLVMTRAEDGWTIDVHGVDGTVERTCKFAGGRIDCPVSQTP